MTSEAAKGVRLFHFTDLHLFSDKATVNKSIRPWETFERLWRQMLAQGADSNDILLLTGDLAQDEAQSTYCMLKEVLATWPGQIWMIPGNHDNPSALHAVFPEQQLNKRVKVYETGGWQIVLIDTHRPGRIDSVLLEAQLSAIEEQLSECHLPAMLVLHHHLKNVDGPKAEQYVIENGQCLLTLLAQFPQVKLTLSGHVHRASCQYEQGVVLYTTPSTCHQQVYQGEPHEFSWPGYRVLHLNSKGDWTTEVCRLRGETV